MVVINYGSSMIMLIMTGKMFYHRSVSVITISHGRQTVPRTMHSSPRIPAALGQTANREPSQNPLLP